MLRSAGHDIRDWEDLHRACLGEALKEFKQQPEETVAVVALYRVACMQTRRLDPEIYLWFRRGQVCEGTDCSLCQSNSR